MPGQLFPVGLPRLDVVRDYGPVGKGASCAHYVLAENGTEYIMKGASFVPTHPNVALNEYLAAVTAIELGLPILDCCTLKWNNDLFFGSSWMESGSFDPMITEPLLGQCQNKDRIYDVVAFDALFCNSDRNNENLVVRNRRGTRLLILNDHSHCLTQPGQSNADLSGKLYGSIDPYLGLPFVRTAIKDVALLCDAVERCRALETDWLISAVTSIPQKFASAADKHLVAQFLIARRDALPGIFFGSATSLSSLGS